MSLRLFYATMVFFWGMISAGLALGQTSFGDTEFDVAGDWASYGPFDTNQDAQNSDLNLQQALTGGNPDAHLELTLTRGTVNSGSVATWTAIINNSFVWDPAEQADGPIGKIDFQLDATIGGVWTLAVRQGEHVWLAVDRRAFHPGGGDWFTLKVDCIDELELIPLPGSQFVVQDQPDRPDFSVEGEPVYFGIGTGLSCPSSSDCSVINPVTFDLDNFAITVNPMFAINAGLNDAWYEPATSGQGMFTIVYPDIELLFLSWFTYDAERPSEDQVSILGDPGHVWLTAQGGYVDNIASLDIFLTAGGVFDKKVPAPDPALPIGTLTIEWCDCNKGKLTYDLPDKGLNGLIWIERVAADNIALCQAIRDQALGF